MVEQRQNVSLMGHRWALWALPGLLYTFLLLGPTGEVFQGLILRIALFCALVFTGALLFRPLSAYPQAVFVTALVYGAFYTAASFFTDLSPSQFSLGWSEGSRYYLASLFFSKSVYGQAYPLPLLHPTRYLLQSIPFLIPELPIWVHRLWQILLWIGLTLCCVWLLARRLPLRQPWHKTAYLAWAFLFLLQGPVYYHLSVPALLVFWAFDSRRFGRSLAIILLASLWAGLSRVNWYPLPGLLAASLYLLEQDWDGKKLIAYFWKPAAWTLAGTAAAFAAHEAYVYFSGNPSELFGSSFSSYMIWHRLLPNTTYPPGILLGSLLTSLPPLLIIGAKLWGRFRQWRPLRTLGLAAILAVFYLGGLVVSVKVGGGSNLHNLDAFYVLLLAIASYFYFDLYRSASPPEVRKLPQAWVLLLLLAIPPLVNGLQAGGRIPLPDLQAERQALGQINSLLRPDEPQPDEVLFITQRQLLTFKAIQGIELTPEYEKMELMEMVMAGNSAYLEAFHNDLASHRFRLILIEPVFPVTQDKSTSFWVENNLWVNKVAFPILDHYQSVALFSDYGIEVFAPKP